MAMDPLTIDSTTIQLFKDADNDDVVDAQEQIATDVTYDASTNTATINPYAILAANTSYKVKVTTGATSTNTTTLENDKVYSFQTSAQTKQANVISSKLIAVGNSDDGLDNDRIIIDFDSAVKFVKADGTIVTDALNDGLLNDLTAVDADLSDFFTVSVDGSLVVADIASIDLAEDNTRVVITLGGGVADGDQDVTSVITKDFTKISAGTKLVDEINGLSIKGSSTIK
jgi:hypothetical protein